MITQNTQPTQAQMNAALETFWDGGALSGSAQWVMLQASDLNNATLPTAVSGSPKQSITQVTGTSFTIPSAFFGVHATAAAIPALAAAGAKSVRTRDQGMRWCDAVAAITNSAASFNAGTSTVNWTGHAMSTANQGIYFWSTGALPSGVSAYQYYYLTNVTANSFQLSASPNGTAIAISGTPSGTLYAVGLNRVLLDPGTGSGTTAGKLNALVAAATANGMDVLFDCSCVPAAISKDGTIYNIPTANTYVTTWIGFLNTIFSANPIQYFEVWNEVNTPGYFNGTTTGGGNDLWSYSAWLKAVMTGSQKIVSPSWTTGGASAMATWVSGASGEYDILAFHAYRGSGGYLGFDTTQVDAFVAALSGYGKPIWITEVGESFPTQALLWRGHLYAAAKGIARVYWYNVDIGAGLGRNIGMQMSGYPGLSSLYQSMITQCAGKTCSYVNRTGATGGMVGANVNGVNVVY